MSTPDTALDFDWWTFWTTLAVQNETSPEPPAGLVEFLLAVANADEPEKMHPEIVTLSDVALAWAVGTMIQAHRMLGEERQPPAPDVVLEAVDAILRALEDEKVRRAD